MTYFKLDNRDIRAMFYNKPKKKKNAFYYSKLYLFSFILMSFVIINSTRRFRHTVFF